MIGNALVYGLIWSLLWMVYVYVVVKYFPWQMLHDFPKDIQDAARIEEPSARKKKVSKIFAGVGGVVLICTPLIWGIVNFTQERVSILQLFLFIFIIVMMWNVVDLFIMDWLIVCKITPDWVVVEGTEGCKGYKDYMFHFKGFLIGCIYSTIAAVVFTGVDYLVLRFLIWE